LSQHVFQSFWFGDTVSPYEKICLQSFLDHGHAFHLFTYSPQLEVPHGVQLRDAAELFDQSNYFTYKRGAGAGSPAAFSNLFRYKLLADRGGWWVDTDVVCLSNDIPNFHEFFAFEKEEVVNGAVLFFQRQDPLILECLDEALRIGDNPSWGEIGPRLITRKALERGRLSAAQPTATCYPIHHSEALDLLRPAQAQSLAARMSESLFLHLWNEIFRRKNVAKKMLPPRGSLLRAIADRHPVNGWQGEYDIDMFEHSLSVEEEVSRLRKEVRKYRKSETKTSPISGLNELTIRPGTAVEAVPSMAEGRPHEKPTSRPSDLQMQLSDCNGGRSDYPPQKKRSRTHGRPMGQTALTRYARKIFNRVQRMFNHVERD
jgi:hypothetical protein